MREHTAVFTLREITGLAMENSSTEREAQLLDFMNRFSPGKGKRRAAAEVAEENEAPAAEASSARGQKKKAKSKRHEWTPAEIKLLKKKHSSGSKVNDLAKEYSCSTATIYQKLK